jgi:hypothetical protein
MSLDIYLGDPGPSSPKLQWEDHGYYHFLRFEKLHVRTRQIDPYGGATFQGESLAALKETLAQARAQVEAKENEWDVLTGWADLSKKTTIHDRVSKKKFLQKISDFSKLVDEAITSHKSIVCCGD